MASGGAPDVTRGARVLPDPFPFRASPFPGYPVEDFDKKRRERNLLSWDFRSTEYRGADAPRVSPPAPRRRPLPEPGALHEESLQRTTP